MPRQNTWTIFLTEVVPGFDRETLYLGNVRQVYLFKALKSVLRGYEPW